MKKLLTLITAAILAASALTATASAATVTMYAEDGRTITVQDYEVSAYRNVGWYTEPFVTMYALDGRSIKVQQSQVPAYQNVGWYTGDDMYWKEYAEPDLQSMYNRNDYISLYFSANNLISDPDSPLYPYSPIYTDALYTYRTRAMDKWRVASGCPVGVTANDWDILEYKSDGTFRYNLDYTNISYKPIIAIKGQFSICDVFGDVLYKTTANIGTSHKLYLSPGETDQNWGYTFSKSDVSYYGLSSARFIRDYKVLEVVFADGTKWVNPSHYSSNGTLSNVYLAAMGFNDTKEPYYITKWIY